MSGGCVDQEAPLDTSDTLLGPYVLLLERESSQHTYTATVFCHKKLIDRDWFVTQWAAKRWATRIARRHMRRKPFREEVVLHP